MISQFIEFFLRKNYRRHLKRAKLANLKEETKTKDIRP